VLMPIIMSLDTLLQLQEQIEKLGNQVTNGIRMVQEDQMRKAPASGNVDGFEN
jgi:hypothetical protein